MYAGFGSSFICTEKNKIDYRKNKNYLDNWCYILTYKNKNRRIRLWVKMYKTLPVCVSITGSLWIRLVISILIASNNDASGPMLTSGIT